MHLCFNFGARDMQAIRLEGTHMTHDAAALREGVSTDTRLQRFELVGQSDLVLQSPPYLLVNGDTTGGRT